MTPRIRKFLRELKAEKEQFNKEMYYAEMRLRQYFNSQKGE